MDFADAPARDPLVPLLRRRLLQHNWQVVGFAAFTLVGAAVLWVLSYFVCYWLLLLGLTAVKGAEAAVPPTFQPTFLAVAGLLLVLAWIDRYFSPDDRARDKKTGAEILADVLLALPRITWAVWWNLSAWQRLTRHDLELAAGLLHTVVAVRKLPLHSTPLEIPDDRTRDKIILSLLLLRVLEVWREGGQPWLRVPLRTTIPQLQPGRTI